MIFSRYTGRDPSWIIIACAFIPDIDYAIEEIQQMHLFDAPFKIHHGDLQKRPVFDCIFPSVCRSTPLFRYPVCWRADLFSHWHCRTFFWGFACFEDLLVFNPAYAFLWPFTSKIVSWGILKGHLNFFGIANDTVLLIGIILLCGALLLRTRIEGTGWWRVFILGGRGGE